MKGGLLAKEAKVQVSQRAVIQRINRALNRQGWQRLKTYRGGRSESDLGRYYVVDLNLNAIIEGDVDLEELARDLGVIAKHETVPVTYRL